MKSLSSHQNNTYLKSLSIENYEIDFSKETKTYNINIKEDVNKLNITAIPEDSNATVEIKGADNLKDSDYVISTPNEIGIRGNNIYTDTVRLIENLNLEERTADKGKKVLITSKSVTTFIINRS